MTTLILVLMVAVIVTGVLISAVAWRYASDARRRDVARAALLRHAATSDNWDDRLDHLERPARVEPSPQPESIPQFEPIAEVSAVDTMFAAETRPRASSSQSWIAIAVVCVVIALVAATVTASRSDAPSVTEVVTAPAAKTETPATPAVVPISLKALSHTRERSGDLTVTGTVQNPAGGAALDHLMAVVDAIDGADQVVATVTSGVDAPVLMAGDTTRFVVAIPRADDVARYRVRFRLRDGSAIEHRDTRAKKAS
ncbi:MAG TPA: hypothetical protein VFV98_15970 [Vicinamibacterales bacterium]|nr:hypothetical protein [Vicinamibacterales bacterium]